MDFNTFKKKAGAYLNHIDYNVKLSALYYFLENRKSEKLQIELDIIEIEKLIKEIENQKKTDLEIKRADKQKHIRQY